MVVSVLVVVGWSLCLFVVGSRLLVVGCCVCCLMFDVCCLLSDLLCLWFDVCGSLCVVC